MSQLDLFQFDEAIGGIVPRDYQRAAHDHCFDLWESRSPGCLIRQPTGTGKTTVGTLIGQTWCDRSGLNRVLVCCHEVQLVQQFADEIEAITGERPGIEMAEQAVDQDCIPRFTVASRATLLERVIDGNRASRLYKFDQSFNWLLICDEAHRWLWSLKSCRHIVEWFSQNERSKRLGLTATPLRGDGRTLAKLFPDVAADYRLFDIDGGPCAVRDGWAVPYDQRFVTVEGVDFKNLREIKGDFDKEELEQVLCEREKLLGLVRPTLALVEKRRTLIFTPTVGMAKAVARTINGELSREAAAIALDGKVPSEVRKDVYARHQRGEFQYLVVCGLCREGYNDPGIGAVAVFRPTKSRSLAEQMKGRGCRPLRGILEGLGSAQERVEAIAASAKPSCMIIDLVGITGLADCASTAHILAEGKPDEVIERANKNAQGKQEDGQPVDMAAEIRQAERELADERKQVEWEQAQRNARIQADVRWQDRRVEQGQGGRVRQSQRGARMPFGKHKGKLLRDISTGYLRTLLEKADIRSGWLKSAIERELQKRSGATAPVVCEIEDINRLFSEA